MSKICTTTSLQQCSYTVVSGSFLTLLPFMLMNTFCILKGHYNCRFDIDTVCKIYAWMLIKCIWSGLDLQMSYYEYVYPQEYVWYPFFFTRVIPWLTPIHPCARSMIFLISVAFFIVMANHFHHQDKAYCDAALLLRLTHRFPLAISAVLTSPNINMFYSFSEARL